MVDILHLPRQLGKIFLIMSGPHHVFPQCEEEFVGFGLIGAKLDFLALRAGAANAAGNDHGRQQYGHRGGTCHHGDGKIEPGKEHDKALCRYVSVITERCRKGQRQCSSENVAEYSAERFHITSITNVFDTELLRELLTTFNCHSFLKPPAPELMSLIRI